MLGGVLQLVKMKDRTYAGARDSLGVVTVTTPALEISLPSLIKGNSETLTGASAPVFIAWNISRLPSGIDANCCQREDWFFDPDI